MPRIRQLSQSIINKIAAGEVIERPASVVKELMENAVDSGATRIDVAIEQGGSALVRVVDNGCGIAADELPLAIAAHATSKIEGADDLFRVATLGFRGEALASIAEVSQLALRSRTGEDSGGAEIEVNGGLVRDPSPCGAPVGTQIEVRNLFFNTPVRRKFLKSTQTEAGHASEAFTRIALAHANIHFTLRHNDRAVFDLPPTTDLRGRVAALFGQALADRLIDVDNRDGDVRLAGYVADPSESRANNRMQYLFLNGRHIRDRSLQHALTEAYRGLLLTARFPIAFMHLSMPADAIDVNVHPTKLEVRFADGGRLYSQLLGTLRTRFLTTDLTARGSAARADGSATANGEDFAATADRDDFDTAAALRRQTELVDWAKGRLADAVAQRSFGSSNSAGGSTTAGAGVADIPPRAPYAREDFLRPHAPLEVFRLNRPAATASDFTVAEEEPEPEGLAEFERATADEGIEHSPAANAAAYRFDAPHALQIHNRYIVTESPEGVVVIDQHALHERILYEQLRAKVLAGAIESQQLLVPEPVDLTPAEAAAVLDRAELLADLGIRVAPFGGGTVIVSSYPAMLANLSPSELLRDVVDRISTDGKTLERRDLVDELLHMIACKAAIKAGDRLTHDEITSLLAARHLAEDAHHCPHGRPTALVFTREELDRQFKRT
jgi:DNA mismatch repair protein MutL